MNYIFSNLKLPVIVITILHAKCLCNWSTGSREENLETVKNIYPNDMKSDEIWHSGVGEEIISFKEKLLSLYRWTDEHSSDLEMLQSFEDGINSKHGPSRYHQILPNKLTVHGQNAEPMLKNYQYSINGVDMYNDLSSLD